MKTNLENTDVQILQLMVIKSICNILPSSGLQVSRDLQYRIFTG